ncbi:MAG: hypothetical protein ACAH95_00285 [Fimbriimonas sp.]
MKRISAGFIALSLAAVCSAQGDILKMIENADRPVRVPIRSADPWFIKAMLEGTPVTQPEISTIQGVGGFGGGGGMGGGFGGGSFGGGGGGQGLGGAGGGQGLDGGQTGGLGGGFGGRGGGQGGAGGGAGQGGAGQGRGQGLLPPGWRVMVNPTDNSLWLIPEKIK